MRRPSVRRGSRTPARSRIFRAVDRLPGGERRCAATRAKTAPRQRSAVTSRPTPRVRPSVCKLPTASTCRALAIRPPARQRAIPPLPTAAPQGAANRARRPGSPATSGCAATSPDRVARTGWTRGHDARFAVGYSAAAPAAPSQTPMCGGSFDVARVPQVPVWHSSPGESPRSHA